MLESQLKKYYLLWWLHAAQLFPHVAAVVLYVGNTRLRVSDRGLVTVGELANESRIH